jgi:hypothetical protein
MPTPDTAAPWWKRLWWRIDRWLIETQRLYEMDDRNE